MIEFNNPSSISRDGRINLEIPMTKDFNQFIIDGELEAIKQL